jgi:acetoin utilization deacetylase AcuC-like enzyme
MTNAAFIYCPEYEADIGPHVFPTEKYRMVRDRLREQGVPDRAFAAPVERERDILGLAHDAGYLDDFFALRATPAVIRSELPITAEIARWFELAVYGTATATRLALDRGAAMHIGGGFHHAFADHAEGFCYLNDVAVAALDVLERPESGVRGVSVVDVDVHQGNGTARILARDPRAFTFSIHQENNYPVKERSNLDIGLPDGIGDREYLELLERGLERAVLQAHPDVVYYVAGADPYREDQLGGLGLTRDGLRERDRRVFAACAGIGAKVVVVLAGGYAVRLEDTVAIHAAAGEEMLARWPLAEAPGTGAPETFTDPSS